jgi:hypothetical protein
MSNSRGLGVRFLTREMVGLRNPRLGIRYDVMVVVVVMGENHDVPPPRNNVDMDMDIIITPYHTYEVF